MSRPVYDLMSPGGWSCWPAPALPVVLWQRPQRRGLAALLSRLFRLNPSHRRTLWTPSK